MDRNSISRYFINEERERKLWKECIFVFDTSALLNFYNYSLETKESLFYVVFPKLSGRLWIPNHVEFEYLKNRRSTLKNPITEKYGKLEEDEIKSLKELSKKFSDQLQNLKNKTKKKFAHPYFNQQIFTSFDTVDERYQQELEKLIQSINEEIELRKEEILQLEKDDKVIEAIETHFSSGKSYTFDQLINIVKEGEFRYKHKIPPGYEDANPKRIKDGIQVFGDLIIWKQLLDYARIAAKPLVLITDDVKIDWCFIEKIGGETRITRPKEELIREILDYASVDFWMYTLSQFLHNLEKYLSIKLEEGILTEVKSNIKNVPLNYDRFYFNGSGNSYRVIKFFEDGEVIHISLGADFTKKEVRDSVNKWFRKGYPENGQYKIFEDKIEFIINASYGTISYNGIIDDGKLILNSFDRIRGEKLLKTFELLEID